MRDALLIAKREYLEQVKGRTFKVTTVLIPLLFGLLIFVLFVASKNSGTGKHVAIASPNASLAKELKEHLEADKNAKTRIDVIAPSHPEDRGHLVQEVEAKQIDGFLWLEETPEGGWKGSYESHTAGDFVTSVRLNNAVNKAVIRQRLIAKGLNPSDVSSVTKNVAIETQQIQNGKEKHSNAMNSFMTAYVMAFLLTFTCVMYGMNVGRSVIQEKTSRVFEVMLASVRAQDLLAGKLIGVGAVGLTQLGIWIVAAGLFSSSALAARLMTGNLDVHISPLEIVLFCIYFTLGYLLYSSLFAGLASTVESEQEFQQYSPLAIVPVWLSFGLITYIVSEPNSFWSVAISMFPPCAPITMFLRMASQFPPLWQIGLSILIMVLTIMMVLWFSTRIYRIGILMYGKRATIPEMLRWLRYS